jgi:hypothetical protein
MKLFKPPAVLEELFRISRQMRRSELLYAINGSQQDRFDYVCRRYAVSALKELMRCGRSVTLVSRASDRIVHHFLRLEKIARTRAS